MPAHPEEDAPERGSSFVPYDQAAAGPGSTLNRGHVLLRLTKTRRGKTGISAASPICVIHGSQR